MYVCDALRISNEKIIKTLEEEPAQESQWDFFQNKFYTNTYLIICDNDTFETD